MDERQIAGSQKWDKIYGDSVFAVETIFLCNSCDLNYCQVRLCIKTT